MSQELWSSIQKPHNSEKFHRISVDIGETPMVFEVGRIAKQASGAVWVRWGDSVVLVTACASSQPRVGADFFPLTCEYVEKYYAAGKIPGGYLKRESRPGAREIINARIIDRSIRPLFPNGFFHEVQVIATVMSHDGQHDTDIMALSGASMALHISNLPYALESGPIAGVRVGRLDNKFIINPTFSQRGESDIDMVVAASKDAIVMVEGGANEVPEADLLEALFFAQGEAKKIITACEDMRTQMGKEKIIFDEPQIEEELFGKVKELAFGNALREALANPEKIERYAQIDTAKERTMSALKEELGETAFAEKAGDIGDYFNKVKKDDMRARVISDKVRLDGRSYDTIRPICCETGILPRTHGSSVFTRGETQAIVSLTLGTSDEEQRLDTLTGDLRRRFMLHYNFPPFCVGEARMLRGTSRREIGHGSLAERALINMIPSKEDFPYTLRIVSEITESNGSSSMASVCGGTLAMWDAGIKLKAPVAGIAMGLIKEGDDVAVLSDILGDEDHLGDMDFKVCGSEAGITAIQMDIKIDGLSKELLGKALEQAKEGRLHILGEMRKSLSEARDELSEFAPRIQSIRINPEKIRDIIGPGGRMIRDIMAKSNAKIDVNDDGIVQISGVGSESVAKAKQIIEDLTREAEVKRVYRGFVKRLLDFGAIVEIFPGAEGLAHISELAENRVENVKDVLSEGDECTVAVLSADRDGKIRLSRKRAIGKEPGDMID